MAVAAAAGSWPTLLKHLVVLTSLLRLHLLLVVVLLEYCRMVVCALQASHHHGRVYVATSEYFGVGNTRVPSIYWAVVDPSENLCKPSLEDWGLLASEQGLALAYPVIAPRDCGAFLAYAYGGNTTIKLDGVSRPAYAGELVGRATRSPGT